MNGATIANNSGGTLTVNGNLTLNNAALAYVPGDLVALTGAGSFSLTGPDYVAPLSAMSTGTYTLATFNSLASGGTGNLFMTGPLVTNRQTYTFSLSSGTALTLTVAGLAGNLQWSGAGSGIWYSGNSSTQNWYNTTSSASDWYFNGDNVTFSDSGASPQVVSIAGTVTPASVNFNNNAVNYTLQAGSIGGFTEPDHERLGIGDAGGKQFLQRRHDDQQRSGQRQCSPGTGDRAASGSAAALSMPTRPRT